MFPKKKTYNLHCEWGSCEAIILDMDDFYGHLDDHFWTDIAAVPIQPGTTLVCQWRECNFATTDGHQLVRHIFFHGFHTKLKWLGYVRHQLSNANECQIHQNRNIIPDLPESGYKCCWEGCSVLFDVPDQFYDHVSEHVFALEDKRMTNGGLQFKCLWEGCTYTYALARNKSSCVGRAKLRGHLPTHTQERRFACPWCGNLYINHTKLIDHFTRQMSTESHSFQCTHCSRTFASERILKDHMRHHVNHYQCPKCAMTCPNPSALKHHIRYKHSSERPFACEFCDYRSKAAHDLHIHMQFHQKDLAYHCQVDGCDYVVRSLQNLRYHYRVKHGTDDGKYRYACHMCTKKYSAGFQLTHHLRKVHQFQLPPGHCRFRYQENEDGMFRLQTFRYESTLTKQLAFIEADDACDDSDSAGTSNSKSALKEGNAKRLTRSSIRSNDAGQSPGTGKPGSSRRTAAGRKGKEKTTNTSPKNTKKTKNKRKSGVVRKVTKKAGKAEQKKKATEESTELLPDLYINSECLEAADALCNMKSNSASKKKHTSPKQIACCSESTSKSVESADSLLDEILGSSGIDLVCDQAPEMVKTRSGSSKKTRAKAKLNFGKARKRLRLHGDDGKSPKRPRKSPDTQSPQKLTKECSIQLFPLEKPVFPDHHKMYCDSEDNDLLDSDATGDPLLTFASTAGDSMDMNLIVSDGGQNLSPQEERTFRAQINASLDSVLLNNNLQHEPGTMEKNLVFPRMLNSTAAPYAKESDQSVVSNDDMTVAVGTAADTPVKTTLVSTVLIESPSGNPFNTHVAMSPSVLAGSTVKLLGLTPQVMLSPARQPGTSGAIVDADFAAGVGDAVYSMQDVDVGAEKQSKRKQVVDVDGGQVVLDDAGNKTVINVGGEEFYLVSGSDGITGDVAYCLVKCSEFVESEA